MLAPPPGVAISAIVMSLSGSASSVTATAAAFAPSLAVYALAANATVMGAPGRVTTTRYSRVVTPSGAVTSAVTTVSPTANAIWCPSSAGSASVSGVYAALASPCVVVALTVICSVSGVTVAV